MTINLLYSTPEAPGLRTPELRVLHSSLSAPLWHRPMATGAGTSADGGAAAAPLPCLACYAGSGKNASHRGRHSRWPPVAKAASATPRVGGMVAGWRKPASARTVGAGAKATSGSASRPKARRDDLIPPPLEVTVSGSSRVKKRVSKKGGTSQGLRSWAGRTAAGSGWRKRAEKKRVRRSACGLAACASGALFWPAYMLPRRRIDLNFKKSPTWRLYNPMDPFSHLWHALFRLLGAAVHCLLAVFMGALVPLRGCQLSTVLKLLAATIVHVATRSSMWRRRACTKTCRSSQAARFGRTGTRLPGLAQLWPLTPHCWGRAARLPSPVRSQRKPRCSVSRRASRRRSSR